ncbi:MAG: hypothetical protein ACR2LH_07830 [Thermoleophilaceae bacterium]
MARRARVSPTAAGGAIAHLIARGLVLEEHRMATTGAAREARILRANLSAPEWPELARALAHIELPPLAPAASANRVPPRLRHLFWNVAPGQLATDEHGAFVARRLLQVGELEGLAWGPCTSRPGTGTTPVAHVGWARSSARSLPTWRPRRDDALPAEVRRALPDDAVGTWEAIAPLLPPPLYLGGGTALAVHIAHRVSRDLAFLYHEHAVDLAAPRRGARNEWPVVVTHAEAGTLNGLFSQTKLQFLHADEVEPQRSRPTGGDASPRSFAASGASVRQAPRWSTS